MTPSPRILILDDGELSEVAAMLERLHIDHLRLRGGQIEDDLEPPSHLLIATPRRAPTVKSGARTGGAGEGPLRIILVDEDSNAMRQMLRRMGFHLLVRRGTHLEVWRLLVERALFQGAERREDPRLPVGAAISFKAFKASRGETERASALLVDVSNRGCRLSTPEMLPPGAHVTLALRLDDQGGDTLHLRGRIVRCGTESEGEGHDYAAAMLFDRDLPESDRMLLTRLLNDLSVGPGSLSYGPAEPLPPCESPVIPGLTLDAETDPAFRAGVPIEIGPMATRDEPAEVIDLHRRRAPRGNFQTRVVGTAVDDEARTRVLMGRDLSAGGMCIERAPDVRVGQRFRLAIYGPARPKPFLVEARVERDDGDRGFALHFVDLPAETARELEKLVACLPDIESLDGGETGGMGAVISEILSRSGED